MRKCNAEAIVPRDAASRRLKGGEKHKVIDWFPDGKLTAITLLRTDTTLDLSQKAKRVRSEEGSGEELFI